MNSDIATYHRSYHQFALVVAGATFVLLLAGALVTSNDAGLSVPDWPTSFGHLLKMPRMAGGVQFEHGHRMLAEFIGLLTIILAVWTWRVERRGWMRLLAVGALLTVILQGVLGGMTVLLFLPVSVSTAHAVLGQTFFCLAVAIALFSGRGWAGADPTPVLGRRRPGLPTLAWLTVLALYLQLILGAMFRHHRVVTDRSDLDWVLPHMATAIAVSVLLLWTTAWVLSRFAAITPLRRPAIAAVVLLIVQLVLGAGSLVTVWRTTPEPLPPMIWTTAAHLCVGAMLLASAVVLAIQAMRYVAPAQARISASKKAVIA
jgi:cytochrome c oxidase assembly protein subunit 15